MSKFFACDLAWIIRLHGPKEVFTGRFPDFAPLGVALGVISVKVKLKNRPSRRKRKIFDSSPPGRAPRAPGVREKQSVEKVKLKEEEKALNWA